MSSRNDTGENARKKQTNGRATKHPTSDHSPDAVSNTTHGSLPALSGSPAAQLVYENSEPSSHANSSYTMREV